jgi:hypothetical protein
MFLSCYDNQIHEHSNPIYISIKELMFAIIKDQNNPIARSFHVIMHTYPLIFLHFIIHDMPAWQYPSFFLLFHRSIRSEIESI